MHWFDLSVTIALILSGVWSCFRGFIRELLSLVGLVAAAVLSIRYYHYGADIFAPLMTLEWVRQAVSFALIFLAVMVVARVCSVLLHLVLHSVGLSVLDRLLGGLLGLAKVALLASVLLIMVGKFSPPVTAQLAAESTLAPLLFRSAAFLTPFIEQYTNDMQQLYKQIQPLP